MTEVASHPEKKRAFDTFDTTVTKVEFLTPRVKGIRFDIDEGKTLDFHAGQFVQMFIPHEGKVRRTSYSVASPPYHNRFFELCVTLVREGISSPYLHKLKEGDKMQAMGPLGRFTLPDAIGRDICFIATGSGIAPFRSMINDLLRKKAGKNLFLLNGNRYEHDIIYRDEWDDLTKANSNFKVLHTLSQADSNWKGRRGYVGDAIADFVPVPKDKDFYICGLVKMIDAVTEKLLSLGIPKEQIHFERYD